MNDEKINALGREMFEKHCGRPHPFEGLQPWVVALVRAAVEQQMERFRSIQEAQQAQAISGRKLSPFDAVARAMDMASLLARAVGRNDREDADAYSARLRSHLAEYIYPAAQPQPLTDAARDVLAERLDDWLKDQW